MHRKENELKTADLNQRLLEAVYYLDVEEVKLLLTQGADKNACMPRGPAFQHDVPAFIVATLQRRKDGEKAKQIMQLLQEAGADLNAETKEQWAAFHYAAYRKDQWAIDFIERHRETETASLIYRIGSQAYHLGLHAYSFLSRAITTEEKSKEDYGVKSNLST